MKLAFQKEDLKKENLKSSKVSTEKQLHHSFIDFKINKLRTQALSIATSDTNIVNMKILNKSLNNFSVKNLTLETRPATLKFKIKFINRSIISEAYFELVEKPESDSSASLSINHYKNLSEIKF